MIHTTTMQDELMRQYPDWVNSDRYLDLCLSDDLDSLFSCKILHRVKGYDIYYFYDFENMYSIGETRKGFLAVDVGLWKGKCWDNHVTMISNEDRYNQQSANINNICHISKENYTDKCAFGTHLQIISYYNAFDFRTLTDQQKILLWCIDSSYMGFYNKRFRQAHDKYRDILELEDLATVLYKYDIAVFEDFKRKYRTNGKIRISDTGTLVTDIDLLGLQQFFPDINLSLPPDRFECVKTFKRTQRHVPHWATYLKRNDVFSLALTQRNTLQFTYKLA